MCGICGIVSEKKRVTEGQLKKMLNVLRHRGPDEEGVYRRGPGKGTGGASAGLGIRRLAVIDLKTGRQPIHNENSSIWLVCNGEIYNFRDLREVLIKKGHSFYTKTDVEVIVHLYEEYGIDCLKYLRGMFAFGLWDEKNARLFLARDRVGQKPLCYLEREGELIFASEIKAILEMPFKRKINHHAMHHYLSFQYVPAPLTMFEGILKLPPAHYIIREKGKTLIERYWELDYTERVWLGEKQLERRVFELLEEAVKLRLVSDVPLGAFLSGGIDSAAVVGLMSRLTSQPVKTFSIGFEEKEYNELEYAREVARYFKTEHHEYIVKPDALKILPKLIRHYGEPYADSSAIPSFYVSRLARKSVTVALNGDGGDESFAGYPRHRAARLAGYFDRLPTSLRKGITLLEKLPARPEQKASTFRLKRLLRHINLPAHERYLHWGFAFDAGGKEKLYSDDFKKEARFSDSAGLLPAGDYDDYLKNALFADVTNYLPNDLLVKMDIATMAYGLEARSPFLDHKLMEFAAAIPSGFKLRGFLGKYILRKALSGFVPEKILRRPKMGFGVPVGRWLRGELREYAYKTILDEGVTHNYFNRDYLRFLLDEHCGGRADFSHQLWTLLIFQLWYGMYVERA